MLIEYLVLSCPERQPILLYMGGHVSICETEDLGKRLWSLNQL